MLYVFVFGRRMGPRRPDLTSLQQHGSSKRHMAVARGVMGDAARHTTTRRKDRPSTPLDELSLLCTCESACTPSKQSRRKIEELWLCTLQATGEHLPGHVIAA